MPYRILSMLDNFSILQQLTGIRCLSSVFMDEAEDNYWIMQAIMLGSIYMLHVHVPGCAFAAILIFYDPKNQFVDESLFCWKQIPCPNVWEIIFPAKTECGVPPQQHAGFKHILEYLQSKWDQRISNK